MNMEEKSDDQHNIDSIIGDVVQLIVPDIPCMQQERNDCQVKSCMHDRSGLQDVHHSLVTNHHSKDSLAALADAAELEGRTEIQYSEAASSCSALAPFLNPTDKDVSFYNEIYHYLCSKSFPGKPTEGHKRIIKKRAANYMITEEGRLAYGNKNTRKVVNDSAEQNYLMKNCHIDETGGHVGVKKMQSYLSSNFHWRSMTNDINNFIKSCHQCGQSFFPASDGSQATETSGVGGTNESPLIFTTWKKVVLHIHRPYKNNQNESRFVVSVSDNFSRWISAKIISGDEIEEQCAEFLFDCFCNFGFTQSEIFDLGPAKFAKLNWAFESKIKQLHDTLGKNKNCALLMDTKIHSEDHSWVEKLIAGFCNIENNNWEETFRVKLFHHNTSFTEAGSSPFTMMFSRNPLSDIYEDEKENSFEDGRTFKAPSTRRRLRSSTHQCRHCYDTFTSKISFRIHQRRHTEEARRRGILDGEQRLGVLSEERNCNSKLKRKRKVIGKGTNRILTIANTDWSDGENKCIPSVMRSHLTQSTVEAVRNLLHATKEERTKRGKYFKYTPELRDQIAQYAMDHSIPSASLYWSDRLCSTVSESSIRNFMKAYKCFSASVKEEIGRYAFNNGIERAAVDYSEKLGFEIRKGIVLKFKKLYTRKVCENNTASGSCTKKNTPYRQKRAFSFLMKDEIGRYAHLHGISAAIDHFSVKLQFSVKESTVRKFKRRYQERGNCASEQIHTGISTQEQGNSLPAEVLPSGLHSSCSNSSPAVGSANTPNNFIYQHSYPINMTPGASMHHNGASAVLPMNHNIAFHQGGVINQGVAALYQQSPATPAVIMNQSFASVAPPSFQQSCINNFSHVGSSVASSQGQPIAIAHTTLTPTASHSNAPLQLTMGGQLTPVPVSHPHLLNHTPTMHHAPQQIISSFPNQITNGIPFDQSVQLTNHPPINFANEPINLLKEGSGGIPVINHVCNINSNHVQPTVGVSEGANVMPTAIVQLPGNNLTQLDQSENPGPSHRINMAQKCIDEEYLDDDLDTSDDEMSDWSIPPKKKQRARKINIAKYNYGCGKRGNYVSYTPELRAEIGRYAAEHGNLEAISHFKDTIGLEIPESTIRGLKDKYLIKRIRGEKDVKSLGFGPRGRPMRLGKYDSVVQDCIRQLVKEGEKISSFLVIATAKQVLTQNEPSLLEENGGPVTLNPTWAKSFLKRIGLNHIT